MRLLKRPCPDCQSSDMPVRLLYFSNRMACPNCFSQFIYPTVTRWLVHLIYAIHVVIAGWIGLFFKSIWLFAILLLVLHFIVEWMIARWSILQPTGRKHRRKKLNSEAYNKK